MHLVFLARDTTDALGNTLLHRVVFANRLGEGELPKVITYLVKDLEVPVNAQNTAGDTALHRTAPAIDTLRALGASSALKNKKGRAPA